MSMMSEFRSGPTFRIGDAKKWEEIDAQAPKPVDKPEKGRRYARNVKAVLKYMAEHVENGMTMNEAWYATPVPYDCRSMLHDDIQDAIWNIADAKYGARFKNAVEWANNAEAQAELIDVLNLAITFEGGYGRRRLMDNLRTYAPRSAA